MYTQCPSCNVIFSMTGEDLKAHHGLVRCGRCQEVFNASWNQVDSLPNAPPAGEEKTALSAREQTAPATDVLDEIEAMDFGPEQVEGLPDSGRRADTIEFELDLAPAPGLGSVSRADEVPIDRDAADGRASASALRVAGQAQDEDADITTGDPKRVVDPFGADIAAEQLTDGLFGAVDAGQQLTGVDPTAEIDWALDTMADSGHGTADQRPRGQDPVEGSEHPILTPPSQRPGELAKPSPPHGGGADILTPRSASITPQDSVPPRDGDESPGAVDAPGESRLSPPPAAMAAGTKPGRRSEYPKPAIRPKLGKLPDAAVVDEEITIEAPFSLWDLDEDAEVDTITLDRPVEKLSIPPRKSPPPADRRQGGADRRDTSHAGAGMAPGRVPPLPTTQASPGPRRAPVAPRANDVRLVEIPYPQPIKTLAWVFASILLLLGIVWQTREYYLSELAEIPALREPLAFFCKYAACTVPPRVDMKLIDLVSTSVDPHPVAPGALRVSANLINRATFAQRLPPLEITLTDKSGAVVGRRTYLPHEYRGNAAYQMLPNVVERVDIDLARPAETAVGYEIQLVAR